MIFERFNPLKEEIFQILDHENKFHNEDLMPKISDKDLISYYKLMCLSRMQDLKQSQFQRQGRLLSFLSSTGQEALEVAYGSHVKKGIDWFVPAYRNNAAMLAAGVPMRNLMLYWVGNEMGSFMPKDVNVLPINIPIATQYSHATGIAFAQKYLNKKGIVITTIGDGGTSEGEFYEAMNFATLHKVPVLFIIENNQFAISTPRSKVSVTKTLAEKGIAVGVPSIVVDGNDFFASYKIVNDSKKYIEEGNGPVLIEFITYRIGPHSSSDDPSIYREQYVDHKEWLKKDPILRLQNYLIEKKLWSKKDQDQLDNENQEFVLKEMEWVEQNKAVQLDDIFKYTYKEIDPILRDEWEEAKQFWEVENGTN